MQRVSALSTRPKLSLPLASEPKGKLTAQLASARCCTKARYPVAQMPKDLLDSPMSGKEDRHCPMQKVLVWRLFLRAWEQMCPYSLRHSSS